MSENAEQSTLWPEDSRARTFPSRGGGPGFQVQGRDCGASSPAAFAVFDPSTSSWRTSQGCLGGEWETYSGSFPPSGTMRSGRASRLPPLARRTSAGASSLWATPQTADAWVPAHTTENTLKRGNPNAKSRSRPGTLTKQVVEPEYWPTPTAGEGTGPGHAGQGGMNLRTAAAMWPTPRASDGIWGGPNQTSGGKPSLVALAARFPTPTAQDAANNGGPSQSSRNTPPPDAVVGGRLNPEFVEWLMGLPEGWTDLGDSGTPSSRRSASGSGD